MSHWLFQADPAKYDILGALRALPEIPWSLRQHADDVKCGDRILIWCSGQSGGIIAVGTAVSEPAVVGIVEAELPFIRDPALNAALPAVRVRVDKLVDPPISRALAKAHPVLSQLAVLKMPRGTNYPVTSEQWRAVGDILQVRGNDDLIGASHPAKTFEELVRLGGVVASGPVPRASREWGGADVIVTPERRTDVDGGFYTEARAVVTEHALALSWLLKRLGDAFFAEGRIDGCSKTEFFGRLANAANDGLYRTPEATEQALCAEVLHEAFSIYYEMEAGRFDHLVVSAHGEIAADRASEGSTGGQSCDLAGSDGQVRGLDIPMPEAIRRIADSEDRGLAWRFFVFFSRFEYALKSTPAYLGHGRYKDAQPGWKAFATVNDEKFWVGVPPDVLKAVQYFQEKPPRIQTVGEDDRLTWADPWAEAGSTELWRLLQAVRHVRNNLFHGGKFAGGRMAEPSRDRELLGHAITILNACVSLDPQVAGHLNEPLAE